jgi:hypothetical protein
MKHITILLAVEDEHEDAVRHDVKHCLGERGGGRASPWIPGAALRDVRSAAVDGEFAFNRATDRRQAPVLAGGTQP